MNNTEAIAIMGALANETRLSVFRLLVSAGPNGMAAGQIAEAINATPSRTSFHLNTLSDAGIVASERQARQITYSVRFEAMGALMSFLLHDCCKGHATVKGCC